MLIPAERKTKMRDKNEIFSLILKIANEDDRIRAAVLSGSRANPAIAEDQYQDYDICFYVTDIKPFYNKPEWITDKLGEVLIMQMPEIMRFPEGDGHFTYLVIFSDMVRIDLSFDFKKYIDDGQPAIVLLDKDHGAGMVPVLGKPNDAIWHIKPPSELYYYSCCNNFWWCLNNAAKGIARDELPYVMNMLNQIVRTELHDMINWYIGIHHGFALSTGKDCKYIKKFLPEAIYRQYEKTWCGADYNDLWDAIYAMCGLFHDLAPAVAERFGFTYRQNEEDAMLKYLRSVRSGIQNSLPLNPS